MATPDPHLLLAENAALRARVAELERLAAAAVRPSAQALSPVIAQLVAHVRDSVIFSDLDGVIRLWNAGAERIFGWRADEMLGRPFSEAYPPEARAGLAAFLAEIAAGGSFAGEWQDYRKDGSRVWIEARVQLVADERGTPVGILGLSTEITDRKRAELALRQSEQLLRLVVESSLESIALTDRDRRLLLFNRVCAERAAALFGRAMAVGDSLDNYVVPETEASYRLNMAKALGGETVAVERSFDLPDGTQRWYAIEYAPARSADGEVAGVCFTARDTTAQWQLQEQLFQAQKLEGIGRLAGGVAHDFNNLLVVISGCAELALSELGPEHPARRDLVELLHTADRAAGLTSRLLAFARRQEVEPQPLDLNEVIRGLRQLFQRLLRADIAIGLELDPTLPAVLADVGQIEQVLVNLVVNAQDAMPQGGRLVISSAKAPDAQPAVVVVVRDSGTGMPEDVVRRAFDPFFTTKLPGEGTGLGLATCYGIIAKHGGTIAIDSAPGRGTTVTFTLPTAAPPPQMRSLPAEPQRAANGSEIVLLVEDDPAVRSLAARILRRRGYGVVEARNGLEALGLAPELLNGVRLLITDVVLPHLSGPALADRLAERLPGLRVLFVSGYGELPAETATAPSKVHTILAKPFSADALARAVRAALDL